MNVDNLFDDVIKYAKEQVNNNSDLEEVFQYANKCLVKIMQSNEEKKINQLNEDYHGFNERNYARWKIGFQKLQMLHQISIEAGRDFQKQFLKYPEYDTDPLLGVLMRQHAHACRITGEIIHLLKGGYPDAAIARWRTLFEIAVTCLILNKHGKEAAEDYIKYGAIKSVEGMEEYQKTAKDMNLELYSDEEISNAVEMKQILKDEFDYHWAKKYTGVAKFGKLSDYIGLGKWSHNYMLASKYIHANYYEMKTLSAMSEAKEDMLLLGQSNSGMTEPAHMTAITLSQITSAFITAYINDENSKLNYNNSAMNMNLIKQYVDDVGNEFLKCN